jgi:hypothetical protein
MGPPRHGVLMVRAPADVIGLNCTVKQLAN